jgi:putative tryptophan/tyrosine transport system substrate-binding protein
MDRRTFLYTAALGLLALPLAASAQQATSVPRIGVLWHAGSPGEEGEYFTSLQRGFRDLGYVEGKTIVLEHRFAGEVYDRFTSYATELVALKVDVLVAVTRPAAVAAQAATKTIPIVFITVPDPVGTKLVDSLAKPGSNITGLSSMNQDIVAKRLELLKEAIPGLTRPALLVNPSDAVATRRTIAGAQAAAGVLNVGVRSYEVRAPEEIGPVFGKIVQDGVKGIFVSNDSMLFNERKQLANLAMEHRLPLLLQNRPGALAGALMSFGPDSRTMFYRAAAYVDKILKGAKPGDLPVEQPTKIELLINLKTAKALGLAIPQSLLLRADEVIQ